MFSKIYFLIHLFIYVFIHLQINILKPSWCLNSIPRQVFCIKIFKENSNFIVLKPCEVIHLSIFMIFIITYIYSYVYLCSYTPSYQHFKSFPVSKFNSETSFLYQLFKENSNFIVFMPCKVIYLSIFFINFNIIYIYS